LARKISTKTKRIGKRVRQERTTPALRGIKVLDMTWVGPGPFCTTLLGDLGAEVIKIHESHPEQRGGLILQVFPNSSDFPGFRNCKTMGLNLKTKEGRKIFYDLSKTADVVIEGSRPGVMKRLGIDYAAIKKMNPAIVYASLTGYGQDGPYRNLVGHDINYISIGGLLGITGTAGGEPVIPGIPIADFAGGGLSAAVAILAALMARERTGKGQFIDVSITDTMVGLMSIWINPYLNWGIACQRGETWLSGQWPWYNVYEAKDGKYISIGALEAGFYANLCQLLGREDFIEHQYAEGEKRDEIFHYFKKTFLTKTRDDWVRILRQKDTCVAPVYSIEELVSDPQLLHRGVIHEMPHPTMGRVKQVGPILKLSDSPFKARNWSTRFGQHTAEIMRTLGYEATSIEALRQKGVIS
jgi:crotonobetainyl-CoA:carnitine CoA-transferase CaiB-like acyl-CoA transferase